jgi:hypothetical protein
MQIYIKKALNRAFGEVNILRQVNSLHNLPIVFNGYPLFQPGLVADILSVSRGGITRIFPAGIDAMLTARKGLYQKRLILSTNQA